MIQLRNPESRIVDEHERKREEIKTALKIFADQLRKKKRNPNYIPTASDVDDAFHRGKFPFSANTIRNYFLRDFNAALEAAGLLFPEQPPNNNAEQTSYPANAAEIWVADFIKRDKRRPSFQEVKDAVKQGKFPHSQTVKRPGNEGIKQMISRLWAKYELHEL